MSDLPKAFRCGCGQFTFTLSGEPTGGELQCHCHSCVAAAKYIDANPGKDGNGISNIDPETGGVALTCFKLGSATFPDGGRKDSDPRDTGSGMGCVKVGDRGKMLRYYTKCCGTPTFVSEKGKLSPLMVNRNALYTDAECTTKYTPSKPPMNIMTKHCFGNKDEIPEPKADTAPVGFILKFLPLMISSSMGLGRGENKFGARKADVEKAEVCPITWE